MNTSPMDNLPKSRIEKGVAITEDSIAKFRQETYHRGHQLTFKTVSSCHRITH